MSAPSPLPEDVFSQAADAGFRARAVSEYNRVRNWAGRDVEFDSGCILDYGCGQGIAAASFALRHPGSRVFGCDIKPVDVALLEQQLRVQLGVDLPRNLQFFQLGDVVEQRQTFDLVYSWSVFEHIAGDQLERAFRQVRQLLRPRKGRFFLQIDPLYFSPRGSHLYRYFSEPWHHLLNSLDELHRGVLAHSDPPGRTEQAWRQFIELNRMTADAILDQAARAGLGIIRKQVRETDREPPDQLLEVYRQSALKVEELMAYFR